jgi:hypothetical protein
MEKSLLHTRGHMFDSVVIKLGHDACLRHCLDAVVSDERSRAIMALLFLSPEDNIELCHLKPQQK